MKDYSRMDDALAFLAPYGPELANGFTNHAPMVSEALAAMGRSDAVMPWLEAHRAQFLPRPSSTHAIDSRQWPQMLGNNDFAAWSAFFALELKSAPWPEVVGRWVARLARGAGAAAAHGIIRTGHAVRCLGENQTPARTQELADAFGYWAAVYATLPVAPSQITPLPPREAIASVPRVHERQYRGSIAASLEALAEFSQFGPVIDLLDVGSDPEHVLADLTETFAHVYLANARDRLQTIVFIHSVTGAAALRTLFPYLPEDTRREALRYAWQASAGLYAAFATEPPAFGDVLVPPGGREAYIGAAVACGDDHAIKFTETCLREYQLNPSPAYLAAAHHAIAMLG